MNFESLTWASIKKIEEIVMYLYQLKTYEYIRVKCACSSDLIKCISDQKLNPASAHKYVLDWCRIHDIDYYQSNQDSSLDEAFNKILDWLQYLAQYKGFKNSTLAKIGEESERLLKSTQK